MHIAICEDHPEEASWLVETIKRWSVKENNQIKVSVFEKTGEFFFTLEDELYDALFLDIQMPGEDGISFAKRLRGQGNDIPIVFVTGMDSYMSEGFEVEAVHYLVKPVEEEKVWGCLDRICQRIQEKQESCLVLETQDGVVCLRERDIIKIEVSGRKCTYTTKKAEYLVADSLKDAMGKVHSQSFVACYRGILVNVCHIESIGRDVIHLTGNQKVPVSRRMYPQVNEAFIHFYKEER